MFKDSYKIILIKEGKFNLRQFSLKPFYIIASILSIVLFTSSLFFIFSDEFINWTGAKEIEKHRKNNQELVEIINESKNRIDLLLNQLDKIKIQDDALRKLVKLPPIHDDIRKMGFGGSQESNNYEDYNYLIPNDLINLKEINNSINYIHRLINLELLSYEELEEGVKGKIDSILRYPAIYPVENGDKRLSSNFGYRRDPFSNKYKYHDGHDYSAKIGAEVYATANGRVRRSKYWGSFGNYIEIDHGNGYVTAYGHLSKRNVENILK